MITVMLTIAVVLLVTIVIVAMLRSSAVYDPFADEEIVTHTTTTTTTHTNDVVTNVGLNVNGIPVVGILERQFLEGTPFVIDPVDKDRVFLNTNDDLYEDGAGKIWGLK